MKNSLSSSLRQKISLGSVALWIEVRKGRNSKNSRKHAVLWNLCRNGERVLVWQLFGSPRLPGWSYWGSLWSGKGSGSPWGGPGPEWSRGWDWPWDNELTPPCDWPVSRGKERSVVWSSIRQAKSMSVRPSMLSRFHPKSNVKKKFW